MHDATDGNFVNKFDTPGPTTKTGPALAKYSLSTGEITFYKDFFDKSANGTPERDCNNFTDVDAQATRNSSVVTEGTHHVVLARTASEPVREADVDLSGRPFGR
ncbi:MAG: hypothetical protein ACRD0W_12145 [Acidimicrobiales bacterium]